MVCPSCQTESKDQVKFCPECGLALDEQSQQKEQSDQTTKKSDTLQNIFQGFSDHVHKAAGFEEKVDIKLKDLFSEAFKKHSEEEAEKLFIVGTSETTPTMDQMIDTWPKPWLFMRIFIIVAIGYAGFYFGFTYFQNLNLLPGLIIVGSFLVPLSLLVFFWEINAPQNIPIYRVAYYVLTGGILSLIIALLFFETAGNLGASVIFIGLIEEAAKVLAILWCLRKRNYHFVLNGLLVGAAVGTGFAAFESAGYALQHAIMDINSMFNTIHLRAILAPGGHIVWAALSGAAICMVKGQNKWKWEMVKDKRFFRIFIIVCVLHMIWNSGISGALFPFSYILLIIVSWIIAFAMINEGLKQISKLKNEYMQKQKEGTAEVQSLPIEVNASGKSIES